MPYPWEGGTDLTVLLTLTLSAAALVMAVTLGKRYLGHENLHTEITPGRYSL